MAVNLNAPEAHSSANGSQSGQRRGANVQSKGLRSRRDVTYEVDDHNDHVAISLTDRECWVEINMSDPYVEKATNDKLTPQQKIDGLKEILNTAKTGMLTTRGTNGELHSRAMAPASLDGLHFTFIINNQSHKTDEMESDPHVNVSFFDPGSNHWVSVAGTAKVMQDKKRAKELWNPFVSAWFGDLGDGVHKGDENDPRVSVVDITPSEIRYWYSTRTKIGSAVEVATSAITGKVAAPGELRTITPQEIALVEGLHMPAHH